MYILANKTRRKKSNKDSAAAPSIDHSFLSFPYYSAVIAGLALLPEFSQRLGNLTCNSAIILLNMIQLFNTSATIIYFIQFIDIYFMIPFVNLCDLFI